MRRLLFAFAVAFVFTLSATAQTASIMVPQQSAFGYPWSALAGSDRVVYVTPVAETDAITAWSGNGSVVTFTSNNHLVAGDIINIRKMTSGGQNFSQQVWKVVSATPSNFTISDGTTGSGTESTGYLQKIEGPNWTGDGTWEIYTTTGAETFRLYTQDGTADSGMVTHPVLTHVPSHINFVVGPTPGVSSTSGSIKTGNFAIHSTIEFDVKFTLEADPTKTATFHYIVAANGGGSPYQGVAHVSPGYRQVFKNRYIPLVGQVFGNTNQMMDWTITASPSGGDATLQFATYPQPVFFSGTVSGQYEITGCPHVDHSAGACDKLAIWVSPNSPPAANADRAEQVPCDVDTTASPTVMDIGPSQTYPDLLSIPQSYAAPLLVRLHNEGPAGHPTEYHNQTQVNMPASGTWDHRHPAFVLCGVPNPTTGELPIIDGANSNANSWASQWLVAPYGLLVVNGIPAGPTFNDGNVKPFHHVTIAGVHIRNVTTGYSYTDHAGAAGTWGGSMGIRPYGIQYWSVIGTYSENVATPYFDDCNSQQSGWAACTLDTFYEGNHAVGYGVAHQSTEHMFYLQAFRDTVLLNLQDGVVPNGEGTSAYSDRGTRSFHMYNRLVPQPGYNTASGPGGHSEIQDAYNYILPDEYWGYQGAADCGTTYSTAPGCSGSYGGEDWFAAVTEEHSNSEFTIGNAYASDSGGAKFLGIATTHNTTGIDNSSKGFYSFNTFYVTPAAVTGGQFFFEDTRLGARSNPDEQYLPSVWPRAFIQNNLMPWKDNSTCAYTCAPFGLYGHVLFDFQTNLIAPGQVIVAANIRPAGWSAGGVFQNGVNTNYSYIDGWSLNPINRNIGGFNSSNFIPYTAFPIDTTSLAPATNSSAVGVASAPTGQLAYYPPRFNAVDAAMSPFKPRNDLTTVGAYDPANAPTLVSISITPAGPLAITYPATSQVAAACTYSDSSVTDCTKAVTWSNGGSTYFSVSSGANGGLVTSLNLAGSGTLTCTLGTIDCNSITVNVTAGSTSGPGQGASGPVGITIAQPPFGFNLIPNATRRIFATVTNGSTNQVTWSVKSGSAKLSSNTGPWVEVTAPATGTTCSYVPGTNGSYSVSSSTQFTIEATAADDPTKTADLTFNVCKPTVQVSVVPFYRTLYASQAADVQSLVLGAVDQTVHWTITQQPTGGDGQLADTNARDTVFTATVPGRYYLTAASNADPNKNATAILYVTGNRLPNNRVTANITEPVDCTVDPKLLGHVYEVGPSQAYTNLASVPFPTMAPGSTVRIHNEDTTGLHPTEYHEYVQISQQGTADQPFRMCGVPDAAGNLPIIDGANATSRSDTSSAISGAALVTLHNENASAFWPDFPGAAYIAVEGIHFRNAKKGFNYTSPDGTPGQWGDSSACVRVNQGQNTAFIGNDYENCGNGVYSAMNSGASWSGTDLNALWEGSRFRNNGAAGSSDSHQLNLQAWGEVVQFNRIEQYTSGATGANLKSRGVQGIERYNYLGDGPSRQMDLVDVLDASPLMSFEAFLNGGANSIHALNASDTYPADLMAAEQEAWNWHFVYGNIYDNGSSSAPIHFSEDHNAGEPSRKGSLFWYNNTFHEKQCAGCSGQKWTLFDTSSGAGNFSSHVEWQTVQAYNNIVWMDDPTKPVFQWNNFNAFIGVAGKNLLTANWGTNDMTGGAGTGWNNDPNPQGYQGASNLGSHLTGFTSTNLITATSMPFDVNTWILNSNTPGSMALPSAVCQMPTRFAYLPSLGYAVPRVSTPNVGATDTAAQTATQNNLVMSTGRINTRYLNCR
jgi:hypothetical protein